MSDLFETLEPEQIVDSAKSLGRTITLAAAAIAFITDDDSRVPEFAKFLGGITGREMDPDQLGMGLIVAGLNLTQFGDLIDARKAEAESRMGGVAVNKLT
jgi:hypothetical protein